MIQRYIESVLHPERYHGHMLKPPFFEGWYYKLVDKTHRHRLAIIPGIFLSQDAENHHAFVQVLDGMAGNATYHRYTASEFVAAKDRFEVQLGENRFNSTSVCLNIQDEQRHIQGEVTFGQLTPWEVTLASPGVMGPFAWIPNMECYHGVLSFDHNLQGGFLLNGAYIDFSGGKGYLEKDWGKGFPSGYVWMQSNHFATDRTSLETAIAIIPSGFGTSFRGMQCGFWHEGQLYKFTTYSGARLKHFRIQEHEVHITYTDRHHQLEINAERAEGTLLHAPIRTEMHRRVNETLKAKIHVKLSNRHGNTLFEGEGINAGLEVHGDIKRLLSYTR